MHKLKAAIYWFSKSHISDTSQYLPLHALSFIMLKLKNYNDCLEFAMSALDLEISDEEIKINLFYLAALSSKHLDLSKNANEAYDQLSKLIHKHEVKELVRITWGILLAPMCTDRKAVARNVSNFQAVINYFCFDKPVELIHKFYDFSKGEFVYKEEGFNYMQSIGFFKRFKLKQLQKKVFPYLKFHKYVKGQIIFVKKDKVHVVIHGNVVMKSHQQWIYPSQLLAVYQEGDLIGSPSGDHLWYDYGVWWIARWNTVTATFDGRPKKPNN
jgi:hypothetical protein